jgi:hypothetical protein
MFLVFCYVFGVLLRPTKSEAIGGVEWEMKPHGYLVPRALIGQLGYRDHVKLSFTLGNVGTSISPSAPHKQNTN